MAAVVTREVATILSLQTQQFENGFRQATAAITGFRTEIRGVQQEIAGLQTTLQEGVAKPLDEIRNHARAAGLRELANDMRSFADIAKGALDDASNSAIQFEAAMRTTNTIAKLSEADFGRFSEQIRTLSPSLGLGVKATEASNAAYNILSSNFRDAASATTVLTESLKSATAGGDSANSAARVLTGTLNAYHVGAEQAAHFSDVLFKTVDLGVVTFPELAQSIGQVAGIASQSGVSFEELNAAIATATVNGLEAPIAIEGLRNVLVHLLSPTKEGARELERLGITVTQASLGQKGLARTLLEINEAANGQASILEKVVGGHRGLTTALALVGDQGKLLTSNLAEINASLGARDAALEEKQKSLLLTQERIAASFDAFKIKAGEAVLPTLKLLATGAEAAVKVLEKLSPTVLNVAGTLGFLTASLVGGAASLLTLQAGLTRLGTLTAASEGSAAALATGLGSRLAGAAGTLATGLGGLGVVIGTVGLAMSAGSLIAEQLESRFIRVAEAAKNARDTAGDLGTRVTEGLVANKDVLTQTAQQIVDAGKGSAELRKALQGVKAAREASQKQADATITDVQAGRAPRIGDANDKAVVAELDKVIKDTQDKIQQIESGAVKASRQAQVSVVRTVSEEELKNRIQEIELSKQSTQQKLTDMRALLQLFGLEGAERRSIISNVAQLERQLHSEQKAANQDRFQDALQDIEVSKASHEEKKQQLEDLAKIYASDADKRRAINKQIAQEEAKIAEEAEKRAQRQAELKAKDAELRRAEAQGRLQDFQRQQARGGDVGDEIAKVLREEGEDTKEKIRAELEKELAKPENREKKTQLELKRQADVKIQQVDADTGRKVQNLDDQVVQDKARKASEQLALDQRVNDSRIASLEQLAGQGKNVEFQLREAILNRLKLTEQNIRIQADAQKSATDDAQRAKTIELDAQAQIFEARKKANDELKRAGELIDENARKQKQGEKGPIHGASTGSFAFTLGTISSDPNAAPAEGSDGGFAARRAKTEAEARAKRDRALTGLGTPQDLLDALAPRTAKDFPTIVPAGPRTGAPDVVTPGRTQAQAPTHVTQNYTTHVNISGQPGTGLTPTNEKQVVDAVYKDMHVQALLTGPGANSFFG